MTNRRKHKHKPGRSLIPKDSPKPRRVAGSLPYEFDLNWDIKTADDLAREWARLDSSVLRLTLARHGYDVAEWVERMEARARRQDRTED